MLCFCSSLCSRVKSLKLKPDLCPKINSRFFLTERCTGYPLSCTMIPDFKGIFNYLKKESEYWGIDGEKKWKNTMNPCLFFWPIQITLTADMYEQCELWCLGWIKEWLFIYCVLIKQILGSTLPSMTEFSDLESHGIKPKIGESRAQTLPLCYTGLPAIKCTWNHRESNPG